MIHKRIFNKKRIWSYPNRDGLVYGRINYVGNLHRKVYGRWFDSLFYYNVAYP